MCLSDDRFAAFLSGLPDKEKEEPLYDHISEYAACGFTARISAASGTAPAAKPRLRPGKEAVSYTHLDVYKRKFIKTYNNEKNTSINE